MRIAQLQVLIVPHKEIMPPVAQSREKSTTRSMPARTSSSTGHLYDQTSNLKQLVTVHRVDVNFAENQGVRHIIGGHVFSESNVIRPKNEPDPIP